MVLRNVVDKMKSCGVVAVIITAIINIEMSKDVKVKMERIAAEHFNRRCRSVDLFEICGLSIKSEIVFVEVTQSLAWYVMCRTAESLDSLWSLYNSSSSELAGFFSSLVNRLCEGHDADRLQLTVHWSEEDYANCRSFFCEKSGLPFGMIESDDMESHDISESMVNVLFKMSSVSQKCVSSV